MNKYFYIILVYSLVMNLSAEIIEQNYFFGNPTIAEKEGFQTISFPQTKLSGKKGEPLLPYYAVRLLLPPGQIAEQIEIVSSDRKKMDAEFLLAPAQPSRPISAGHSGEFVINEQIYDSENSYPENQHGKLITQFMNGHAIALTTITPIVYFPQQKDIFYFGKITVRIKTRSSSNFPYEKMNSNKIGRIKKFVQNPEMSFRYNYPLRDDEYQILIITPTIFQNELSALEQHYLQQGLLSQITSLAEITSSQPGQDVAEKMRNYIIQEYQDHAIEHVILVGDVEHLPYRGFYCYVESGNGYQDDDIPADLYFSALDGNWNDDGDDLWGEIGEEDLLPEIAVARISVSTTDELQNMLNKTFAFENQPVLGELRNPLLAGENLYNDPLTWGGDYLDLLVGFHDDNGYVTDGIPNDHNITTMYDRDLGSWNGSELIAEINQGQSFIHHSGHSSAEYTMRLTNSDITNNNFSQVNGIDHNFTFVYSHGCICGAFDHDDCIAERMTNIENFLVAFVGNSRYGWFNEGQTEGPSAHLHREFVDALYTDKYQRIGRAHMESKIETAPWVTAPGQWEEGALRWCFYDCNVLGSSALPVWTDEPLALTANFDPVIFLGEEEFSITISQNGIPAENIRCTILQNDELIGTAQTDITGFAEINFDPMLLSTGSAELFISGYNLPPEEHQLQVVPAGYFINVTDHSLQAGNDDVIEFGENALLSLTLADIGNVGDLHNVFVEITTNDNFIQINDNFENIGLFPNGGTLELNDAFDFDVSEALPDEHDFAIEITIFSDEGEWTSTLDLTGFAANIELLNITVLDNNNSFLDPGETAELTLTFQNSGGADLYQILPQIFTDNQLVEITNYFPQLDSLNAGYETEALICSIELDENIQLGESIDFLFQIAGHNNFAQTEEFSLLVGLSIEDFETGDFSLFDWQFSGNADWYITSDSYQGSFATRSGNIDNNNFSELSLQLEVIAEGEISFWKKISSEADYDFLKFYIDDILQEQWSGEIDWSESVYPVSSGIHTFSWKYQKDTYVSNGEDCAWLDQITFPPISGDVSSNEILLPAKIELLGNYPNPFNPSTTINFNSTAENTKSTEIVIYNLKGQKIRTIEYICRDNTGSSHSIIWNGRDENDEPVSSGVYFYRLKTNGETIASSKMLLLK